MKSPTPCRTALSWLPALLLAVSVAACEADDALNTATPTAANTAVQGTHTPNFHPDEDGMARSTIALTCTRPRSSLGDHCV